MASEFKRKRIKKPKKAKSRGGAAKVFKLVVKVVLSIVFVAAVALPAVFMNTLFGYLPILLVVFIVAVSVASLIYISKHVHTLTEAHDVSCYRGQKADLGLMLRNDAKLACPRAMADIYVSDLFGSRSGVQKVLCMLPAKSDIDFGFDIDMAHVGVYRLGIDSIRLSDPMGIFRKNVKIGGRFDATVLPRIRPIEELHFSDDDAIPTTAHTRSTVMGGFDYTGVREYEIGDPMKQIHWKLSAHTREYMTKLRESNQHQEFAVILDFASMPYGSTETLMDVNDALIETSLSLVSEVALHDLAHKILFFGKDGSVVRTAMPRSEGIVDLVTKFATITPDPDAAFPDACSILLDESQEYNRSTNVLIVTSRPTDDLIREIIRVKAQGRTPELYVIVPAAWTTREVEEFIAPVRTLDEYGVAFFVMTTEPGVAAAKAGDR